MALKKAKRLPRKYNRPVSAKTRALAGRREKRRKQWKKERFRRWLRRMQRMHKEWQSFILRWFLAMVIIVLVGVFMFLLFSPMVRIREITISRTDPRLDIEQVQVSLASLFGRHTMLLPKFEVLSLLEDAIPDLNSVDIVKVYPAELTISITLDPLIATLDIVPLGENPDVFTGATMDYLTDKGIYISTSEHQHAEELPSIRVTDWGARPQIGQAIVSKEFLEQMQNAEDALATQFGQETLIRAIYMQAQEFHLLVDAPASGAGGQYSIWFDVQSSLEDHLLRYRTFLHSIGPDAILEHIDLRLTDRVIYK